jgi:hypothetical protein
VFSVLINHPDLGLCIKAVDALASGLVVAMDYFAADGPYENPAIPNACDNLCGPDEAGFLLGVEAAFDEVYSSWRHAYSVLRHLLNSCHHPICICWWRRVL